LHYLNHKPAKKAPCGTRSSPLAYVAFFDTVTFFNKTNAIEYMVKIIDTFIKNDF
jgi:hypothetical protein